jgi:putative acetyltransferase
VEIRPARPADAQAIRKVHLDAFPTRAETDLVEQLVRDGDAAISIVANSDHVVGHALLSRMAAEADGHTIAALGLAPVAVHPDRQGQGIGSALIEAALRHAREAGTEMVFVLGEPGYYGRFGFDAAAAKPFASAYAGPYFQALPLRTLPAVESGFAHYGPAFADLG